MSSWNVKKSWRSSKVRIYLRIRSKICPKSRKNRPWVKRLFRWMIARNRYFRWKRPKFMILRRTTRNFRICLLWAQMDHLRAFSSNQLKTKTKGSKLRRPDTIIRKYVCTKTWPHLLRWAQYSTVRRATSPHNSILCIRTSKSGSYETKTIIPKCNTYRKSSSKAENNKQGSKVAPEKF